MMSTGVLISQVVSSSTKTESASGDERIKEYLINNPGVVISAIEKFQMQKQAEMNQQAKKNLAEKKADLFSSKDDPRIGSDSAKIKVVEFFDYNCGYCKKMLGAKSKLIAENPDVQIIFKEMPILSEASYALARASLSVYMASPDKYFAFQQALLSGGHSADVSEDAMVSVAKGVGVDEKAFRAAYKDEAKIKSVFQNNTRLAYELGVRGTPAYVVGNELIPGYVSYEELKKHIEQARQSSAN